jgi:hypothetical protein
MVLSFSSPLIKTQLQKDADPKIHARPGRLEREPEAKPFVFRVLSIQMPARRRELSMILRQFSR